jgi:hypothetical protein
LPEASYRGYSVAPIECVVPLHAVDVPVDKSRDHIAAGHAEARRS